MAEPRGPSSLELRALEQARQRLADGLPHEALAIIRPLAALRYEAPDWNDALGTLFTFCEQPRIGLTHFQLAVASNPGNPAYLYNLAAAQRMVGEFAVAETLLEQVIAARPQDIAAYHMLADLRRQTQARNHVSQLRALLRDAQLRPTARIMLHFTLGKELEDLEDCGSAIEHFTRGCALERARIRYDVGDDVATLAEIAHCFRGVALASAGDAGQGCLFVTGLPRSGTTLLERMLSRHRDVRTLGESVAFPSAVVHAVREQFGRNFPKRELVRRTLELDPERLATRYLQAIRASPDETERAITLDKQPLNYLYLGLLHRALPRARLIVITREPMDSCFAMLKTLFVGAYPFSYDHDDVASYYLAWRALIEHWIESLGEALILVSYEDLVRDPEVTLRRALLHVRLPWDPQCLSFSDGDAVTSASAVQVRQPLYRSSIGGWRRYEASLQPLSARLAGVTAPRVNALGA